MVQQVDDKTHASICRLGDVQKTRKYRWNAGGKSAIGGDEDSCQYRKEEREGNFDDFRKHYEDKGQEKESP